MVEAMSREVEHKIGSLLFAIESVVIDHRAKEGKWWVWSRENRSLSSPPGHQKWHRLSLTHGSGPSEDVRERIADALSFAILPFERIVRRAGCQLHRCRLWQAGGHHGAPRTASTSSSSYSTAIVQWLPSTGTDTGGCFDRILAHINEPELAIDQKWARNVHYLKRLVRIWQFRINLLFQYFQHLSWMDAWH